MAEESKEILEAVSKYLEGANPLTEKMKQEEIELKGRITVLENKESDAQGRVETLEKREKGLLSSVEVLEGQKTSLTNDIEALVRSHTSEASRIDVEKTRLKKDIETLIRQKESLETEIKAVGVDYDEVISLKSKKLEEVVRKLTETRTLLKEEERFESLSKGHWIREIQKILDRKNMKVDILKELG